MTWNTNYRVEEDVTSIIENALYKSLGGMDGNFGVLEPANVFTITTGLGGAYLVNKGLQNKTKGTGLIVAGSNLPSLTEFSRIDYSLPFLGRVHVEVDTALDEYQAIPDNKHINGFLQSSYNMTLKKEDGTVIGHMNCTGKRPELLEELSILIRECELDKQYNIEASVLRTYIVNQLNMFKTNN